MQSVNSRLADPVEGISDGIIGTILAFASFGVSASVSIFVPQRSWNFDLLE